MVRSIAILRVERMMVNSASPYIYVYVHAECNVMQKSKAPIRYSMDRS